MPVAAVDLDLFDTLADAIDFVASCGGGVVRLPDSPDMRTLYWQSLIALAEQRGVRIEPAAP